MKTHIKTIFGLAAGALLLTACNDSFLDRNPTSDLVDKDFWNTASDLEVYNNGIYNQAGDNDDYMFLVGFTNDPYNSSAWSAIACEAQTDNFASLSSAQQWATKIGAGQETVPNNPDRGGWKWDLLRRCNVFFENYHKADVLETIKQQYAGEVYFFRAWFYLDKVQKYGDVPYVTKALDTDSPELYGKRTPRKDVMDSVLVDIDKACAYLPVAWDKSKPNRVDKGTALALKSRICLYEGTYRKYHNLGDYEKYLQEAVKASEDLIALNKYKVYNTGKPESDYTALFSSPDLSTNPEVIFYRKYEAGVLGNRMSGYIVLMNAGATKDFVDDFLCLDSDGEARPVSLSTDYKEDTYQNVLTNRDPRLTQTILDPLKAKNVLYNQDKYQFPILNGMDGWKTTTGYHVIKYYNKDEDAKGYGNEGTDAPLFRYAEVLLNLAEAKAELGTINQTDLDNTVNLLRKRAGMPDLTLTPPMDPKYAGEGITSLLVEIRRERRVELSFEMSRYPDLMRWKWGKRLAEPMLGMRFEAADSESEQFKNADVQTVEVNGKHYIDAFAGNDFGKRVFDEEKHYLHPIPVNVRSKNPELGQNPKW